MRMAIERVISARHLSKSYRTYLRPADLLKELVLRRSYSDLFWALRDVSFTVEAGQRLGVIGPNGSGKSTLLRILTGNLEPTAGAVEVNGRISAMLSLNSFFNPEQSGYKNINLNLLIHGCPATQVQAKIEDIVEFAELGPFIYKPVKTYSAGMVARLSFAITTALDPDVLVVDEVLSVGDAYFNAKAMRRMESVCARGRALVFVSHSIADVCRLCNVALWLDHGGVRAYGPVHEVTQHYEEDYRRQEDAILREQNRVRAAQRLDPQMIASLSHDMDRLRISAAQHGGALSSVHYVRRITARLPGAPTAVIELGDQPVDNADSWIWPDVIGCEWGRGHEHRGSPCRLLYAQTGRQRGGLLMLARPPSVHGDVALELTFESSADDANDQLTAQLLDVETQQWVDADVLGREALGGGWARVRCRMTLKHQSVESFASHRARLLEQSRPAVEIIASEIWSGGEPRFVLSEGQPFDIRVTIEARQPVPCMDVGIKLIRSDGTYVFWQTSGQVGHNLIDFQGRAVLVFSFDPNPLGGGEYLLTVTCHNGWDPETNYPHSQVFDRRVNACQFTIRRKNAQIDFGVVCLPVPVEVRREPLVQAA
jgi:lipopolysaccharide transport system ATP-binding protein